jgi:GrpB-like predicted nucleotidyltransferase (UPF0157 family)
MSIDYEKEYQDLIRLYQELVDMGVDDIGLGQLQNVWAKFVAFKVTFNTFYLDAQTAEMAVEQERQIEFARLFTRKYKTGPVAIRKYQAIADPKHQELSDTVQEYKAVKSQFNKYVLNCTDIIRFLSRVMTARLEELKSGSRMA